MKSVFLKRMLIGLIAGFITGFLGTGGGILLIPAFMYILKLDSIESRATSICCIFFMAIVSSFFYYKNDFINWHIGILTAVGGTIGGYIGAKLLNKIPDYILRILFIFLLIYVAIRMLVIS